MEKVAKGKAWKFGHEISNDTDIFPFRYVLEVSGGAPLEKFVSHVMESANPEFGKRVRKGDFIVAGRNFGHGKAHREGVECFKILGVAAVIADSVSAGFFKNSVYFALPALTGEGVSEKVKQGDELQVDMWTGEIKNLTTGETFRANPVVPEGHPLFPIMEAGGQIEYVKKKVASVKKL